MQRLLLLLFLLPNPSSGQCWQSIDAGNSHTLAIKPNGTLWSWGNNDHIKLGWNNATPSSTPGIVSNATNWVSISAGSAHSAAINSDGKLFTWGNNTYGECGDGNSGSLYAANSLNQIGTNNWNMVSCGGAYTLLIKSDGTLWSTGDNSNGKCGRGTSVSYIPAQIGSDNNWKQVSANSTYSIGVKTNGTLWFWGYGYQGNGSNTTTNNIPIQIGTDTDWDKIGTRGTVAIKSNGTLWGWGFNNSLIPIQIGSDNNWKLVSYSTHLIGIKNNSTLWLWGNNSNGQLGNGTLTTNWTPTQFGTDTNWSTATVGSNFSEALNTNGFVFACGVNTFGQLGIGNNIIITSNVTSFTPVVCNTLNTTIFSKNDFKIYPNPSNKFIFIENNTTGKINNITISDLTGKIILKTYSQFSELNIEALENGIYLINISVENVNYYYKLIKK
jgi:alpha-tubulin suppressor-like RCC1 family protein